MKHYRSLQLAACMLMQALIVGCAALGVSTPKTFIDRAVAAQLTATAVLRSADSLLNAGVINVADAKNTLATVVTANKAIDLATQAYLAACPLLPVNGAVDTACTAPAADAKLASAIALLTVVQTYLNNLNTKGKS